MKIQVQRVLSLFLKQAYLQEIWQKLRNPTLTYAHQEEALQKKYDLKREIMILDNHYGYVRALVAQELEKLNRSNG